jgi:hypothetical protein
MDHRHLKFQKLGEKIRKTWSSIEIEIEISLLTKSGPQEGIYK